MVNKRECENECEMMILCFAEGGILGTTLKQFIPISLLSLVIVFVLFTQIILPQGTNSGECPFNKFLHRNVSSTNLSD